MILMEHNSTCSSINNSDIALPSIVSVHNELGNKVVAVVFAYP